MFIQLSVRESRCARHFKIEKEERDSKYHSGIIINKTYLYFKIKYFSEEKKNIYARETLMDSCGKYCALIFLSQMYDGKVILINFRKTVKYFQHVCRGMLEAIRRLTVSPSVGW